MPEGDTVFRTAASLREALVGKTLTRCDIRVPRYATVDLSGHVVDEVLSRGKHLFIRVGPASIHSHLKMDGSWRIAPRGVPAHKIRILLRAGNHTAAGIDLGVLEVLTAPTIRTRWPTSGRTCWVRTGIRTWRRRTWSPTRIVRLPPP